MTAIGRGDGPVTLTVTAHMLSDWHVGSGAGRHGLVDRGVQRDRDGLPFVPAKTLVGLWRDACETAGRALDGGDPDGVWQQWVEFLFGSQPALRERGVLSGTSSGRPQPAALHVDSLHYPTGIRSALQSRPLLRAAATFVKPGVAIDPATGRSADELLRFEEMAAGGIELSGTAELTSGGRTPLTEAQLACASALLDAGARLVDALGGRRRRGAGRCRLQVSGLHQDWRWLESHPPPPLPAAVATTAPRLRPAARRSPTHRGSEWEVVDLRLVLRRPLIAHERTMGNVVRSASRLPGWVLLPGVLQRLNSAEAAAAAREGELVVTDATVEVAGQAGRPEPLSLVRAKSDPDRLFNLLRERPPGDLPTVPADPDTYVGPYRPGEPLARAVCDFTEHTHNTIDDQQQRPIEAVGGLYIYQAIAEGTVLRAQVRLPAGLMPRGWGNLSGDWRIGHSRKDGYGSCEVTATEAIGGRPVWQVPDRVVGPGGRLSVWLQSDVLVMDERLRPSTRARDLAHVLGTALGVELAEVRGETSGVEPGAAEHGRPAHFSERRRSDSWHTRWGLPRTSLLGLRAGSCFSFEVISGTVTEAAVARVQLTGVGRRRAEGFGQVLIDDPLLNAQFGGARPVGRAGQDTAAGRTTVSTGGGKDKELSGAAPAMLTVLEEAAWRESLRRHSQVLAGLGRKKVLGAEHERVPPSQLAGLLSLLPALRGPGDPAAHAWLERLRQVPGEQRRRPWPDPAVEAVTRLLGEAQRVWDLLELPEDELTASPERISGLRERLWLLAVRTVLEDCLTALRRIERAPGPGANGGR